MDEKLFRIKINLSDREIEIEGDKDFIKEELYQLLGELKASEETKVGTEGTYTPGEPTESSGKNESIPYIKTFVKEKNPQSAKDTAVVIAYYLYKYKNKPSFDKKTLEEWWRAAGAKPPKHIWQSVIDSKNENKWFELVSKGEYKISTHGIYHVENELPEQKD